MSKQNFNFTISVLPIENAIELPIGTNITIGKIKYQVVSAERGKMSGECFGCMMSHDHCPAFRCSSICRYDNHGVIFKITNLEDQL